MSGREIDANSMRLAALFLVIGLTACVDGARLGPIDSAGGVSVADHDRALNAASVRGLRRSQGDPGSALGMAEAALGTGDLDKAAKLFELAERSASRPVARSLQGYGLIALRRGQTERALRFLRDALDREPGLWRSEIGLARAHLSTDNPVGAMEALERAEQKAGQNASALNDIGMVFLTDKVPERAVAYFERALVLEAQHPSARSNIRIARAMLGDYDAAVAGVAPDDAADALNNAGYAAILNGAYEAADRLLRRALEVSPVYHAAARANLELLNQASAGAIARGQAPHSSVDAAGFAEPNQTPPIERDPSRQKSPTSGSNLVQTTNDDRERHSNEMATVPPENAYRWAHEPIVSDAVQAAEFNYADQTQSSTSNDDKGYRWVAEDSDGESTSGATVDVATAN